ncbi:MAG: undecaprenyldiphospho-muramoylpentapeptide beta-N-acetylglucosaminyltransferase [Rhodothermaceae bacterium]|nr:undecaprenyldiphospho-muramoylpentapeptide beta-N-acetylglucosaminyltransferase [Rhodothermaceae bacterium]
MTTRVPRILIAGGGTGGHVYPAIAIADAIRSQSPDSAIAFAGTQEKLEWTAVPKAGYPIHPITVQGFHRGSIKRNIPFPFKLLAGLMQSWRLVGDFDPDIVVGTGGFVSGPVLYAAHKRKRPIVIQEQNAFPGITNKLLSRYAHTIHIAFKEAIPHLGNRNCILSGNPTRAILQESLRDKALTYFEIPYDAQVLLVFGGSLGSAGINKIMETMISNLLAKDNVYVIWQTGSMYYDDIAKRNSMHPRLKLLKYIDHMEYAYAVADLAVVRSGAITCSELTITGTPSILIPSPNVAEDHQTNNAKSLASEGAALLVPEKSMHDVLLDTILKALKDSEGLQNMREAAKKLARPNAAKDIAASILGIVNS